MYELLERMRAGDRLRCVPREVSGDYSGPPEQTHDWFLGKEKLAESMGVGNLDFDESRDEVGVIEWSNPRARDRDFAVWIKVTDEGSVWCNGLREVASILLVEDSGNLRDMAERAGYEVDFDAEWNVHILRRHVVD